MRSLSAILSLALWSVCSVESRRSVATAGSRVINGRRYGVAEYGSVYGVHDGNGKGRVKKVTGLTRKSTNDFAKRHFGLSKGASHALANEAIVRRATLELHNQLRNNISLGTMAGQPKPFENLAPLIWDTKLEQSAQEYARKCIWQHSQLHGVGENLAISIHGISTDDVAGAASAAVTRTAVRGNVAGWIREYRDFSAPYTVGTCRTGAKCGHYTQMVSDRTTRMGCAMSFCSRVSLWKSPPPGYLASHLVCHYSPHGNIIGQTPYHFGSSAKNTPKQSAWKRTPISRASLGRPAPPSAPQPRRSNPAAFTAKPLPAYWTKRSRDCTIVCPKAHQTPIFDRKSGTCYCF